MRRLTTFLFALISIAAVQAEERPVTDSGPQWNSWSPEVFEQARRDGKLILVGLVADWCSFCKKMDAPKADTTADRREEFRNGR